MTAALEEILKAAGDAARALTTVGETDKDLSEEMTALAYTYARRIAAVTWTRVTCCPRIDCDTRCRTRLPRCSAA